VGCFSLLKETSQGFAKPMRSAYNDNEVTSSPSLLPYTRGALDILRASLLHMQSGQPAFYRAAAVQLRLLLCDSTRRHNRRVDLALLPQAAPDLRLPRLTPHGEPDEAQPPLPLAEWLEQPLAPPGCAPLSVRQLIRLVCDRDGGAHVDPNPQLLPAETAAGLIAKIGAAVLNALPPGYFC